MNLGRTECSFGAQIASKYNMDKVANQLSKLHSRIDHNMQILTEPMTLISGPGYISSKTINIVILRYL